MPCCCTNILTLCEVGTCATDEIDLGILAKIQGEHTLKLYFLESIFTIKKTFQINDRIKFPTSALNENYTFKAEAFEPNGARIIIEKSGLNYDCVQFRTKIQYDAS